MSNIKIHSKVQQLASPPLGDSAGGGVAAVAHRIAVCVSPERSEPRSGHYAGCGVEGWRE